MPTVRTTSPTREERALRDADPAAFDSSLSPAENRRLTRLGVVESGKEKRRREGIAATRKDAIGDLARMICAGGTVTENLDLWARRYVEAFDEDHYPEDVRSDAVRRSDGSPRTFVKEA